jgi:hypothetical protein
VWKWLAENWIALSAAVIAGLALVHTWRVERRRVVERERDRAEAQRLREEDRALIEEDREAAEEDRRQRSISFELEYDAFIGQEHWYRLWFTGDVKCHFRLDRGGLMNWAARDNTFGIAEPGEDVGSISIKPNGDDLPGSVTIIVTAPFETKRVVRVPRPPRVVAGAEPSSSPAD